MFVLPPVDTPALVVTRPPLSPSTPQQSEGALWRTDRAFTSYLRIKNVLLHAPLPVTPVLYMADGTELDLPALTLPPAGAVSLNLNEALNEALRGRPHSDRGMAGVKYTYAWQAVVATVQSIDEQESITFHSSLSADAHAIADPAAPVGTRTIQGMWWLPSREGSGFLTLANANPKPVEAQVAFYDAAHRLLEQRTLSIPTHATRRLLLDRLFDKAEDRDRTPTGSLTITYSGLASSLAATEGLEDRQAGYSISPHLSEAVTDPAFVQPAPALVKLAAPGIRVGPADPTAGFPARTTFVPYGYLANTTGHALAVDILASPAEGGTPTKLSTVALPPNGTTQADLSALLKQPGTPGKYVNLTLSYQGTPTDLYAELGATDQTRNYIFETAPTLETPGIGKTICYWSIAGDNDSAVVLWNYTDKPSEELLTLDYKGGSYKLPITLAPGASRPVSIKQLERDQTPDQDGKIIPAGTLEGSGMLTAASGETDPTNIALFTATFNVRTATCGVGCLTCNGVTSFIVTPSNPSLSLQQQVQMQGVQTYNTGTVQNTTAGSWSSSTPPVAGVNNTGITTGNSGGTANISLVLNSVPIYAASVCSSMTVMCPIAGQLGAQGPVRVQIPSAISVTNDTLSTVSCGNNAFSLLRVLTYQVLDQSNLTLDFSPVLRENVPTTTSSCNGSVVQTGAQCFLSRTVQPGGLSNFNDNLSPGCPSAGFSTPCGFTFPNQQWQWCQPSGIMSVIGTIGQDVVNNNSISIDGNTTNLTGTIFHP